MVNTRSVEKRVQITMKIFKLYKTVQRYYIVYVCNVLILLLVKCQVRLVGKLALQTDKDGIS